MKATEDYIQDLEKDLAELRTDYKRGNETLFVHCPCGCCGESLVVRRYETHNRSTTIEILNTFPWPEGESNMIQ